MVENEKNFQLIFIQKNLQNLVLSANTTYKCRYNKTKYEN